MAIDPPWRILCVDDEHGIVDNVRDFLEDEEVDAFGSKPVVTTDTKFDDSLTQLERSRFDLLILDVRVGAGGGDDEEAGLRALEQIRERRFLPVVFYTNIPGAVEHLATSPLIHVVEKTRGLDSLLKAVRGAFATGLPEVNRALIRHVEDVQREYMWDFVGNNWERFGETPDRASLAHLLARRLAVSLSGSGVERLAAALGEEAPPAAEGRVEPMRYYLLPWVEKTPLAGDLYHGRIGDIEGYWVLLTPSCDLANEPVKAEFVLLAKCLPLEEQQEYRAWREKLPVPGPAQKKKLELLMRNRREKTQPERYYFLPAALTLPNLIVDLQQIEKIPTAELDQFDRLASLDSPFAEALVALFTRYFGRLGTPDLNTDSVLARLRRSVEGEASAL